MKTFSLMEKVEKRSVCRFACLLRDLVQVFKGVFFSNSQWGFFYKKKKCMNRYEDTFTNGEVEKRSVCRFGCLLGDIVQVFKGDFFFFLVIASGEKIFF